MTMMGTSLPDAVAMTANAKPNCTTIVCVEDWYIGSAAPDLTRMKSFVSSHASKNSLFRKLSRPALPAARVERSSPLYRRNTKGL